jgi:hypothetical protein
LGPRRERQHRKPQKQHAGLGVPEDDLRAVRVFHDGSPFLRIRLDEADAQAATGLRENHNFVFLKV